MRRAKALFQSASRRVAAGLGEGAGEAAVSVSVSDSRRSRWIQAWSCWWHDSARVARWDSWGEKGANFACWVKAASWR